MKRAKHVLDGEFRPGTEGAIIQTFLRAGACDASTAQSLASLGLKETDGVNALRRRGLLRETSPSGSRLYLDKAAYNENRLRSQRTVIGLCVLLVFAIAALAI